MSNPTGAQHTAVTLDVGMAAIPAARAPVDLYGRYFVRAYAAALKTLWFLPVRQRCLWAPFELKMPPAEARRLHCMAVQALGPAAQDRFVAACQAVASLPAELQDKILRIAVPERERQPGPTWLHTPHVAKDGRLRVRLPRIELQSHAGRRAAARVAAVLSRCGPVVAADCGDPANAVWVAAVEREHRPPGCTSSSHVVGTLALRGSAGPTDILQAVAQLDPGPGPGPHQRGLAVQRGPHGGLEMVDEAGEAGWVARKWPRDAPQLRGVASSCTLHDRVHGAHGVPDADWYQTPGRLRFPRVVVCDPGSNGLAATVTHTLTLLAVGTGGSKFRLKLPPNTEALPRKPSHAPVQTMLIRATAPPPPPPQTPRAPPSAPQAPPSARSATACARPPKRCKRTAA